MNCQASGDPEPSINWLRNESMLVNSTKYSILENGSLWIRDIEDSDAGNYSCQAANIAGVQMATTNLIIYSEAYILSMYMHTCTCMHEHTHTQTQTYTDTHTTHTHIPHAHTRTHSSIYVRIHVHTHTHTHTHVPYCHTASVNYLHLLCNFIYYSNSNCHNSKSSSDWGTRSITCVEMHHVWFSQSCCHLAL